MYYNRLLCIQGSIKVTLGVVRQGTAPEFDYYGGIALLANEGSNEKKLSTHPPHRPAKAGCTP